jgi:hypothetical protein
MEIRHHWFREDTPDTDAELKKYGEIVINKEEASLQ